MEQKQIDQANVEFWDELCGSAFAKMLGITDHAPESLRKFDHAYFDFYPYLLQHVKVHEMKGKKVLEAGLGYGTLGGKIAESGADYTGLDIAAGPVKMMNRRLGLSRLAGRAIQGSMLTCPVDAESQDFVVSIGCFHHTGDVQKCIEETYRVLRPGGRAFLMVYNQFSYRQWVKWPVKTFKMLLKDWGWTSQQNKVTEIQRKSYDANSTGEAAPETVFLSICRLREMFASFSSVRFEKENCNDLYLRGSLLISRKKLLPMLGKWAGFDIYIEAQK
ncbi:MAG: class I SAM-dependent methyltransferase [Candidatus Omnitrophica bacterium]|nr:class I SAM-dependent methyltransferase [Candidatus Omnitrophota bacterium]